MPFIKFDEARIYYEQHGNGAPLLCLHGWNDSSDTFKKNILEDLSKNYNVVLLDFPGYGKSEDCDLSFDSICNIITILLDTLKLSKISILGFCMGATIALDYSIRNPDKINKLFLIETYVDFPLILFPLTFNKFGDFLLNFFLSKRIGISLTKKVLLINDFKYQKNFFKKYQKENTNVSIKYIQMLWKYSKLKHYHRMQKIVTPTKLIIGDRTSKKIKNTAKRISKNIPNSAISLLEKSGHFPFIENRDAFLRMLEL